MEAIRFRYGHDFGRYAHSYLQRRLEYILNESDEMDLMEIISNIVRDKKYFEKILSMMTVTASSFFRDPHFFVSLKEKIFPILETYPSLKIWVAGCSSGEEVYSLAIALTEANLIERTTIYATDINPHILEVAKKGIYPLQKIKDLNKNYTLAFGEKTPTDYYTVEYNHARIKPELREHIEFFEHNLATDNRFLEAHLILCRNVLIYFNNDLQNRVLELLKKSLVYRGVLGIGSNETIALSGVSNDFDIEDKDQSLFRLRESVTSPELFYE